MTGGPVRRALWLILGLASVALGVVGAFLPILPTVPFLILAAFAFSRSNPAWEARLLNHPRYGSTLRAWREKGIISRTGKKAATGAFALSILLALIFMALPWSLLPILVAVPCLSWIWTRPEA
ncbi:MAG: YbaN family protein [Chakrabartia sp.]